MITFVQWAKEIDAAFRAFYPTVALEGETVELEPRQNATHYLLGTSRIGVNGIISLINEFNNNVIITETEPEEF